jgi:UTP--glucose-1-phosphate uridylyltransferase
MVPESSIEPLEVEPVGHVDVDPVEARAALDRTVVLKLNGGLGTSMGMDRAKSLIEARDGLTFLDVMVRQVLTLRRKHGVRLPLVLLNSFRTREDTLAALEAYPDLPADLPVDVVQNREPRLLADDLTPVSWPQDPSLEWCPPGHGDLYPSLLDSGLLAAMREAGYTQVFVSNSDNLGAVATPEMAAWFAASGAPFAIESVRRTASDRKGGHFARRRSDGRIILRETAQTAPEDKAALADLDTHRYASTNNLWFDVAAMADLLEARGGVLRLPLIRNVKTVDPTDPSTPTVIQAESAMGAAIELFEGATTVEVGRDRFVPVKTTDDLLVLRSDCYRLDDDHVLRPAREVPPFVALGTPYTFIRGFEARFPAGAPSLARADSLEVDDDWTFGAGVRVEGSVRLPEGGGEVPDGTVLDGTVLDRTVWDGSGLDGSGEDLAVSG